MKSTWVGGQTHGAQTLTGVCVIIGSTRSFMIRVTSLSPVTINGKACWHFTVPKSIRSCKWVMSIPLELENPEHTLLCLEAHSAGNKLSRLRQEMYNIFTKFYQCSPPMIVWSIGTTSKLSNYIHRHDHQISFLLYSGLFWCPRNSIPLHLTDSSRKVSWDRQVVWREMHLNLI